MNRFTNDFKLATSIYVVIISHTCVYEIMKI